MDNSEILDMQLSWFDAIVVLASDIVSYFMHELGIESFYTIELRDLARQIISEGEKSEVIWPDFTLKRLPDEFLQIIEEKLGSEVAQSLIKWQTLVRPGHDMDILYDNWFDCFHDLIEQWDMRKHDQDVPLSEPDASSLRIRVRDYISHYRNVSDEVRRIRQTEFEWDSRPKPHLEPYNALKDDPTAKYQEGIAVTSLFYNYYSSEFWCGFVEDLSQGQIDDLLNWAKNLKSEGEPYPNSIPVIQ